MFGLRDFYHLPQVETLVDEIASSGHGLVVVAGPDANPLPGSLTGLTLLPSGRSAIFGMLVDHLLTAHPRLRAQVIAAGRQAYRPARHFKNRVSYSLVQPPFSYQGRLEETSRGKPGLVVLDQLSPENIPVALEHAQAGMWIISQLDTVFCGADVTRQLVELGASSQQLGGLGWVFSVQRVATLCPVCKQPSMPGPDQLANIEAHYATLIDIMEMESPLQPAKTVPRQAKMLPGKLSGEIGTFYQAAGCPRCQGSGRRGDLVVFDIFQVDPQAGDLFNQPSRLAMQTYLLYLASLGQVALEEAINFEKEQSRRVYYRLAASEKRLAEIQASLERQLAEQVAARQVLEQRTRSLVSLQEISQTLISSANLDDLAWRVVRCAGELCEADRSVLYYLLPDDQVEVLAALGWTKDRLPPRLARQEVFALGESPEPLAFPRWPPGIPYRHPDVEGAELRAGLYIPLLAQEALVGLMVVHATRKDAFKPGEVALLQVLSNQAALAIQRAGLVSQLQARIVDLQTAQAELVKKERLERELEIARQVQASMLPKSFPRVAGVHFAARYEPARYVGGDLYDVIELDENHIGIAIGDVSDKGLPAALYMALTRSLLLAESSRTFSPRTVLERINLLLIELGQLNMFVTIFYGVVELSTRVITYACAGHEHPWLLRAGQAGELGSQGTPLGILAAADLHLSQETIGLQPGDRLVLYTDGLADVESRAGNLYGRRRLKALLEESGGLQPEQLCGLVFEKLLVFQGGREQFDDMALLVMALED